MAWSFRGRQRSSIVWIEARLRGWRLRAESPDGAGTAHATTRDGGESARMCMSN